MAEDLCKLNRCPPSNQFLVCDRPAASTLSPPYMRRKRMQLIWPWQDRIRKFSWLKATTFALMFAPAIWLVYQVGTQQFGPVPLGGMTYWSGFWSLALLLLALAITPAM